MKSNHDSQGDHLPAHIARILDNPAAAPTPEQQARLRQGRLRALEHFDRKAAERIGAQEKLGLWAQRHTRLLRRGTAALSFAVITGAGLMVVGELLAEEEAVDTAVLSQDLPLESLLEPHFSRGMHD
ncbi:hypothetical protein CEK28_13305 [Xenophilus sp. AP218F]|nr:DUF3619 family protein [Chromobacterium sp. ASV5]OWY38243.1 hypothetical protein CEK28_13305 [Xenophilus sp. AP218F]